MEKGRVYSHFYSNKNLIIPRKEILRYMSCKQEDDCVKSLIDRLLPVVAESVCPRGSFVYLPVECCGDGVYVGGEYLKSESLKNNLKDCNFAVIFALSCGISIDMLIKKHSAKSALEAFCINATATAAIEEYADRFCMEMAKEVQKEGLYTYPRFSPGYGDVSLEVQRHFFSLLPCTQRIGLTLTDSLVMAPEKSVTAFIGMERV